MGASAMSFVWQHFPYVRCDSPHPHNSSSLSSARRSKGKGTDWRPGHRPNSRRCRCRNAHKLYRSRRSTSGSPRHQVPSIESNAHTEPSGQFVWRGPIQVTGKLGEPQKPQLRIAGTEYEMPVRKVASDEDAGRSAEPVRSQSPCSCTHTRAPG